MAISHEIFMVRNHYAHVARDTHRLQLHMGLHYWKVLNTVKHWLCIEPEDRIPIFLLDYKPEWSNTSQAEYFCMSSEWSSINVFVPNFMDMSFYELEAYREWGGIPKNKMHLLDVFVLAHELRHHVQYKKGMLAHADDGEGKVWCGEVWTKDRMETTTYKKLPWEQDANAFATFVLNRME
jgi:hypothetical protein